MFRFAAALSAAVYFVAGTASASWIYQGEKSAFGGSGTHIVLTGKGGYGFGFRCDKEGIKAVYLTPEKVTSADLEGKDLAGQLLIRVDGNEVHAEPAEVDSASDKLRLSAGVEPAILKEIRSGKKKVAVAVKVGETVLHEASFPTQGAKDALSKFINGCDAAESLRG